MPDSPRYPNLKAPFDPKAFVSNPGIGIAVERFQKNQQVFAQGEAAETVCYLGVRPRNRTGKRKIAAGREDADRKRRPDDDGCNLYGIALALSACDFRRTGTAYRDGPPDDHSIQRSPMIYRKGIGRICGALLHAGESDGTDD